MCVESHAGSASGWIDRDAGVKCMRCGCLKSQTDMSTSFLMSTTHSSLSHVQYPTVVRRTNGAHGLSPVCVFSILYSPFVHVHPIRRQIRRRAQILAHRHTGLYLRAPRAEGMREWNVVRQGGQAITTLWIYYVAYITHTQ